MPENVETVLLAGEGGAVQAYDLPLREVFVDQVERGDLRPVDDDGVAVRFEVVTDDRGVRTFLLSGPADTPDELGDEGDPVDEKATELYHRLIGLGFHPHEDLAGINPIPDEDEAAELLALDDQDLLDVLALQDLVPAPADDDRPLIERLQDLDDGELDEDGFGTVIELDDERYRFDSNEDVWLVEVDDEGGHRWVPVPVDPEIPVRPANNASTDDWRTYAVHKGLDPDVADGMTRGDLIDRYPEEG